MSIDIRRCLSRWAPIGGLAVGMITAIGWVDSRIGRVEDRIQNEIIDLRVDLREKRREIGNLTLTVELMRLGRIEVSPTGMITSEDEAELRRIIETYDLDTLDWREYIWFPTENDDYWSEVEVPEGD